MDWKKGILTVVITASLAVCPFSAAFAEWGDSDRTLLVEIEDGVVSIIPGRLDLLRADVTDILTTLTNISGTLNDIEGKHFWHDDSANSALGYAVNDSTHKTLGAWLSEISGTLKSNAPTIDWSSSTTSGLLGYNMHSNTQKTLGYWLGEISSKLDNAKESIDWHADSANSALGYAVNDSTHKTLGAWLSEISGTLKSNAPTIDWSSSTTSGLLGYNMHSNTQKTLGYWLGEISTKLDNAKNTIDWSKSGTSGVLGYYMHGNNQKTLGYWLGEISTKLDSVKQTINWKSSGVDGLLGYYMHGNNQKTLGYWLGEISTRINNAKNTIDWSSSGTSGVLGYYIHGNNQKTLGYWLGEISGKLNNIGGGSSVWTNQNVSDLLTYTESIKDSVSDLASGLDGGGLYYLNVIADELHKTDPGYLKEWLIDIYDAIGTQTTQLQEAIEGISAGGSSGGGSADLSTIEGLLGKLTYYSDGATGYILKVHDLGVFDNLTDVNNELIGIRTLLGQFFAADTASDVIGEVDFSEIADKSNATLDTISTLAPFGSILLYSECVAILSTTPAVQEPKLVFDFNFCPGLNEHITLDLSWLDPMHDAINFACMLMLVMGLASITMRYVELEAAS